MSSFVQHLFTFPSAEFEATNFIKHVLLSIEDSDIYENQVLYLAENLPFDDEDRVYDCDEITTLNNLFDRIKDFEFGCYFTLMHQETQEDHGFSIQVKNKEDFLYLAIDWRVSIKSLTIDETAFVIKLNELLKATSIYSCANWLGSVCFVHQTLEDILEWNFDVKKLF
jgi:hypothetical protein